MLDKGLQLQEPSLSESLEKYRPVHLPFVMPEELLCGYLLRVACVSGEPRMKGFVEWLVGRVALQPPWTLPTNLNELCERLAPVFSSPAEMVENHSCLPAHLAFVPMDALNSLDKNIYDGVKSPGLAAVIGLSGRAIESRPVLALCKQCAKEDKLKHGFAWWRREHALAGLGYCTTHGTPLVAGCRRCRFSQAESRAPRLPQMQCWCGEPHRLSHPVVSLADGETLTRMTRMAVLLLRGALAGQSASGIGAYYHLCAFKAGFSAGGRLKSPKLVASVLQRYSGDVLSRLNSRVTTDQGWLYKAIAAKTAPNVLGRNLLLLDFFGKRVPTTEDFVEAEEHVRALTRRKPQADVPQWQSDGEKFVEQDRQEILAYLGENPDASRTQILRALGRVVVRARARDSVWYDALLRQKSRGRPPDSQEKQDSYWAMLDERTSVHVRTRRIELLSETGGKPKRLTRTALLKGVRRGNEVSEEWLQRMPLTRESLARCLETSHEFKVRYATAILLRPKPGLDMAKEAQRRTGLPLDEVDHLNERLRLQRSA